MLWVNIEVKLTIVPWHANHLNKKLNGKREVIMNT